MSTISVRFICHHRRVSMFGFLSRQQKGSQTSECSPLKIAFNARQWWRKLVIWTQLQAKGWHSPQNESNHIFYWQTTLFVVNTMSDTMPLLNQSITILNDTIPDTIQLLKKWQVCHHLLRNNIRFWIWNFLVMTEELRKEDDDGRRWLLKKVCVRHPCISSKKWWMTWQVIRYLVYPSGQKDWHFQNDKRR